MEKLLPRCSREKVALLADTQMALRDYMVAEKLLVVGLDPEVPAEAERLPELFRGCPAGVQLFWGERVGPPAETRKLLADPNGRSVPALSRAENVRLILGANVGNLSFHARVPAYMPLRQLKRLAQHNPVSYVTFLSPGMATSTSPSAACARGTTTPAATCRWAGSHRAPSWRPPFSPLTTPMPGGPAPTSSCRPPPAPATFLPPTRRRSPRSPPKLPRPPGRPT